MLFTQCSSEDERVEWRFEIIDGAMDIEFCIQLLATKTVPSAVPKVLDALSSPFDWDGTSSYIAATRESAIEVQLPSKGAEDCSEVNLLPPTRLVSHSGFLKLKTHHVSCASASASASTSGAGTGAGDCFVRFRWSNRHSWFTSKAMKHAVQVRKAISERVSHPETASSSDSVP